MLSRALFRPLRRPCGRLSCMRSFSDSQSPEEIAGTSAEASRRQLERQKPHLHTILSHAGINPDPTAPNKAMAPPIHLASTYKRPADGTYLTDDSKYSRMDNPTRLAFERAMYEAETHGIDCDGQGASFAFASGMMAVTSILLAHESPVTILFPTDLYHGVTTVLADVFRRHDVSVLHVDMNKVENVVDAIQTLDPSHVNNAIVWMETPSNPKCQVIDIQAMCEAVKKIESDVTVTTVVDSTLSPPTITQPIKLGVDLVMHSGTKYIAGHSDALLGVVTASPITERGKAISPVLQKTQIDTGGVASAFDCWLALRGMRTLALRAERQSKSALYLAEYLESRHPLVSAVHYPGLKSHPHHDVAARQMNDGMYGGVFSIEMSDAVQATALAGALTIIERATSLGGTETLVEHRSSIEPAGRVTSPPGLLRFAVGLESPEDLKRDLELALSIVKEMNS